MPIPTVPATTPAALAGAGVTQRGGAQARVEVGGPGPVVVVRPSGELDIAAAAELRNALLEACARATERVDVDCTAVTFIDSTALGVLAAAAKRLVTQKCRLRMINVAPNVGRAVKLAGLWDYLGVEGGD